MLFHSDGMWLRYKPFRRYQLPEVVSLDETVRVSKDGETGHIFYLRWPGMGVPHYDDPLCCEIPQDILRSWCESIPSDRSLRSLLSGGSVPSSPPISVAYHVAVNTHRIRWSKDGVTRWDNDDIPLASDGLPPFSVAGLPPDALRYVLGQRFALDASYLGAVKYLKWLAEGHRNHPLFRLFDTMIEEELMDVSTRCAQLFFFLLGDCIWDFKSKEPFFSRDLDRFAWAPMASYLHFAGRVGVGRIEDQSGIDKWRDRQTMPFKVFESIDSWDSEGSRDASRVSWREPGIKRAKRRS